MKWKSHLEIADAISDQLELPPHLRRVLRQGSVEPDREGDKQLVRDWRGARHRRRVRHHHASRRFIASLLWKARVAHLEGREEDAVWCLGRALHYIQDRSVSPGPFGLRHDQLEEALSRRGIPAEAIQLGRSVAMPSPYFVDLSLRSLSPKKKSSSALHQACVLSSAMSFAVLEDLEPDRGRSGDLEQRQRKLSHLLLPLAFVASLSLIALGLALGQPLLLLSSLPVTALVYSLDARSSMLRDELNWLDTRA